MNGDAKSDQASIGPELLLAMRLIGKAIYAGLPQSHGDIDEAVIALRHVLQLERVPCLLQ
jgi:hypothetical protein